MEESTLISVFNMMMERLGKVEDAQQALAKSNEDLKHKLFATFIQADKNICRLDTFFTDIYVHMWVSKPMYIYTSNCIEMFEISMTSTYSKFSLTKEMKKNITDIIPDHSSPMSVDRCCDREYSHLNVVTILAASEFGFGDFSDKNSIFDYYQGMIRCVTEYVKKVEIASGLSIETCRIKKMEYDDTDEEDSDEE